MITPGWLLGGAVTLAVVAGDVFAFWAVFKLADAVLVLIHRARHASDRSDRGRNKP